jgi:prevent-host-death family protein
MTRTPAPIETVKASEARQHFSELVNRVHETGERVMIEKNGAAVVGLVSRRDMLRLAQIDAERASEQAALDRLRSGFDDVSEEEMEREIANAVAKVRHEARAKREAEMLVKR